MLDKYIHNNLLRIKVIPNASRTELKEINGGLKLYLQAVPEKGKANQAVIKFFKKEYHLKVEIKSGSKSRDKVLRLT
ncbi:DUF167 domain-containing protein [Candidatus Woesearchaeota archaeon]|jgi:uncharacterized protein|nr:DUF167 domain-containing protein [Candidatus Woesearchaeota archaeon]MBT5343218.1 DUF167 domain-containing protein [Candidatus Woesearchaeota archaeon]